MDDQEYIEDELRSRIDYLEKINDSLRKEIRAQKKEISLLKKEQKNDLPPEYNCSLELK